MSKNPNDEWDIDEEWAREAAEEEADRQRKAEPAPSLSQEMFLAWRSPRQACPPACRLDNPLWQWLVRTRWSAYQANEIFAGPSPFSAGPMWCFDRFGMSETPLADGRVVYIGGEHEDHYDPDFCIYNDVVVVGPAGDIAIFGYPSEIFPPTDFHSATLVGKSIFIIGRLGYSQQRVPGKTPVYRLALGTMEISEVATSGEAPGWIYRHHCELSRDGRSIVVSGGERWMGHDRATSENIDSWSFDTLTGEWQRLSRRDWQRWVMLRVDRKRSRLWDVRQALWHRDHPGMESSWKHDDQPDFAALEMLYRPDDTSPPPTEGREYRVFSSVLDGVTVRFREESFWVEAIVEGRLPAARLEAFQRRTLALIERLEGTPCEIEAADEDGLQSTNQAST